MNTNYLSRNARSRMVFLLLWLVFSGCGQSATDVFRDANMDFGSLRTVAVMPLVNQSREQLAAERVRDVLMTMLLSTGAVYVVPTGEVSRGISRTGIADPTAPSPEDIVKFAGVIKADAVMTGAVREYGEIRSGTTTSQVVSISLRLIEAQTGRVVWSASSTKGGVTFMDRLLGGGGTPMNETTEEAVNEIIDKLFQ